jgi:hypothetical protein
MTLQMSMTLAQLGRMTINSRLQSCLHFIGVPSALATGKLLLVVLLVTTDVLLISVYGEKVNFTFRAIFKSSAIDLALYYDQLPGGELGSRSTNPHGTSSYYLIITLLVHHENSDDREFSTWRWCRDGHQHGCRTVLLFTETTYRS